VIIATRADPPLMLPRLRVRSQLSEIRAAELRFTAAESTELLNQALDFHLSPVQIDTLQARTEGWIAGLQMAALAMQGQKDRASFIQTFSGSNRYIMDYLMEEVLRQSDPDIQQFLLNTSILDHFNAALCDAILQRHGSQLVLERLEGENLFLIPLDSERGWYRYHHLFGELLNNRLKQIQPDLIPVLHDRASHWYESHGNIPEAIRQAQAAGDSQRVHDLVETNTLAILDYGELAGLVEWLGMLDQKAHYSRPHLSLAHAWALLYAGQLDEIEGVLENAEAAIQPGQNTDDVLDIQGQMAAIRAYLYSLKGDLNRKEQYAVEALERLPMQNSAVRAFAAGQLSHVYRFRGKLEESASILQKVIAQNVEGQDSHIWIDVACDLAGLRMAQGRRREAAAIFQEIISRSKKVTEQGSRPNPEVASAYINYGWVLREWNDLPAAQQCTEEAVRLAEQWGQKDLLQVCYFEQARLLQTLGEPDAARRVIQKAKELTSTLSPFARRAADREEALLCLRQGNLQAASQWRKASGLTAQDEIGIHKLYPYRVFARVLLAEGEFAEGIPLLERLLAIEEEIGEGEQVINLLSLLALVLYQLGRVDQAIPLLEKSLALAEPEGFVRTFVDEGPPMADLLRVACENDRIKDTRLSMYAAHLLSAFSTAV